MESGDRGAVVVGASSGIGAACVRELVRRGYRVAALARREADLAAACRAADPEGRGLARPYVHDVRAREEVPALFARIADDLGGISMLVYAAAVMPRISLDTYDAAIDAEIMEVNATGCMAWMDAAAPYFRSRGRGRLAGISSIAGDRGRRGNPAYHASKAAMDTFLESLRNRLWRDGISVTTIKPGYVDTPMTKGMPGLFWLIAPETAAATLLDAAERGRRVRYVPWRWTLVGLAIRNIPSFLFRRMRI